MTRSNSRKNSRPGSAGRQVAFKSDSSKSKSPNNQSSSNSTNSSKSNKTNPQSKSSNNQDSSDVDDGDEESSFSEDSDVPQSPTTEDDASASELNNSSDMDSDTSTASDASSAHIIQDAINRKLSVSASEGPNLHQLAELRLEAKLESYDPTMTLSRERVALARADTSGRIYTVYADGVFDLFHVGHMKMLEQAAKALGDIRKTRLIVGVCSDQLVHMYKGKTVLNHTIRCESVRHCKWVSQVAEDAPWVLDDEFLTKHSIDFVAHDAIPYKDTTGNASSSSDVYAHIKERGMFLETQRTEGLSTSDVIVQIIRDYDEYVMRSLARGYNKSELNVGKSWQMRFKWHEREKGMKQRKSAVKSQWKSTEDAIRAFIGEFNPRYLVRRSSRHALYWTPKNYVERLQQNLPARSQGVCHHATGLFKAVIRTAWHAAGYANPISYIIRDKAKDK